MAVTQIAVQVLDPLSSVNIITTHCENIHRAHIHTQTHIHTDTLAHEPLIQIGANRLAVIINKHGGLILHALSLL